MEVARARLGCLLVLLLALPLVAVADDEPKTPPTHVEAVVYEVFHGDSLHRLGLYVREIHVPSRGFAFYVWQGELRVFRPEPHRYRIPGEKVGLTAQDGSRLEVPWLQLQGCETRCVGTTRIRVEDADRFASLLGEKTKLRALADGYLQPRARFEMVVAFLDMNQAAAAFVMRVLDEAGVLFVGVSNAGGTCLSVPEARAKEARLILYAALLEGLKTPPSESYGQDTPDPYDYRIVGPHGQVIWTYDRTRVPPAPPHADVLAHLLRFPGSESVQEGGQARQPKYGDLDLEQAEQELKGKLPRPWTVALLKKAYQEDTIPDARAALIYLLAASRSADVLPLVGTALSDEDLDVRVKATYGILTYWDEQGVPAGGTEQAMDRAHQWWKARAR